MKSIKDFDLNQITKDKEYFPSPREWEDQTLYFLMVDRFSNGQEQNLYDPEKDYENALQSEDKKKE